MNMIVLMRVAGYVVGILGIITGFILTLMMFIDKNNINNHRRITGPLSLITGCAMLMVAHIGLPKIQAEAEKSEAHFEQAMNEYTWYLDGNAVDPKTIPINDYKRTYNDNDKIVVLSEKSPTESHHIALFFGVLAIFLLGSKLLLPDN